MASDNNDLLLTEPTVEAPDFDARTFATCQEFESTMEKILPKQNNYYWRGGPVMLESTNADAVTAPVPTAAKSAQWVGATTPHSETNVQVAGIDEADSVKTDGRYIYSYQAGESGIVILDAKTLNKVKTIKIPANYSNPIFYVQKGKLILTATRSVNPSRYWMGWYDNSQKSVVAIYDISTPASAKLIRLTQVDGSLSDTRLEDNGLMTVVVSTSYWTPPYYRMMMEGGKTPSYSYATRNLVPRISDVIYNGSKRIATNRAIAECRGMTALLPSEKTLDTYSFSPSLTSIIRLDTSVRDSKVNSSVVLSQAGQIHVSRNSIYLTSNLWTPYSTSNSTTKCAPGSPCATSMIWNPGVSSTLVHRFAFDRLSTKYVYSALVPGNPLTQYSMDEDASKNLRIITSEWKDTQSTRLSIIGPTGKSVGKITDIAPGENFQSSRFIGDRLYLVTFEQIDPFFVIDLSNVENPKILGELKIPGYSTYLHPYDANRLIGVGYDTKTNQWWGTQNAGIKVDLYNVSDVKNPKQEATLTLGDVGSSSDVLWNPRAFVYYKEKKLLLMPATLMTSAGDPDNSYLAKSAFQWLVGLSLEPGRITEKFRISHIEKTESMNTDWKNACNNGGYGSWTPVYCKVWATLELYLANNLWNYSSQFVNRVLYVGESLYTIGESRIQMQNFASPTVPTAVQNFRVQSQNVGYPMPIDIMPAAR